MHQTLGHGSRLGWLPVVEEGTKVKELESLIHFWKDNLTEQRLLMSPSCVYLVEQTVKTLEAVKAIGDAGLFVARLNNGDWMAGKADRIYHINVTRDHYSDPHLVVRNALPDAVSQARAKYSGGCDEHRSEAVEGNQERRLHRHAAEGTHRQEVQ